MPQLHRGSGARSLWFGSLAYLVALVVLRLDRRARARPGRRVGNALTGSLYSKFAADMATSLVDPGKYAAVGRLLIAHCAVAACLAGPALVAGLAQMPGRVRAASGSTRFARALAALTAWLLVALIVMTAVFTVAVGETNRLHLRYYGFCIPLLFVGLAACEAAGIWTRRQQVLGLGVWLLGIVLCELFVAIICGRPSTPRSSSSGRG